jgi:hypothetical protein
MPAHIFRLAYLPAHPTACATSSTLLMQQILAPNFLELITEVLNPNFQKPDAGRTIQPKREIAKLIARP